MKALKSCFFVAVIVLGCWSKEAAAAWGVTLYFENDCRRAIDVTIIGDTSGTITIGPYDTKSFTLCTGWCTGFLGAAKTYYYSYSAITSESRYDCFWSSQSYSLTISGFDLGGVSNTHGFTCDYCANDPPPPSPPPPRPPPPSPPPPRPRPPRPSPRPSPSTIFLTSPSPQATQRGPTDNSPPYGSSVNAGAGDPYYSYPSAAETSTETSSGTNVGAIVGGVVGGLVGLALIIGLIVFLMRPMKQGEAQPNSNGDSNGPMPPADRNGAMKVAQSGSFDPYLSWLQSVEETQGPVNLSHKNEFAYRDVTVLNPIGEGAFGKVYKATYQDQAVALKIFQTKEYTGDSSEQAIEVLKRMSQKVLERMEKEVEFLGTLDHPNIVAFLGFCRIPPCIMTELCSQGSLAQKIYACKEFNKPLLWPKRVRYITEAAQGLQYLHSKNIVHRDLKSPNILLNDKDTAKLSDFNLSKYIDTSMNSTSLKADNPRWLAPELFEGQPPSLASDIYAFGIVMWEVLMLSIPWEGETSWAIAEQIRQGQRPSFEHNGKVCSLPAFKSYTELMEHCWTTDASSRPTAETVLQRLSEMSRK